MAATTDPAPGLFGKLPMRGDFVSRRLPARFVEAWDDWLRRDIACSRDVLAEDWLPLYLAGPLWRFALPPNLLSEDAVAGVLMPSVDAVNRHFPLTVAATAPPALGPFVLAAEADPWFAAAEAVALSCLDPDATMSSVERSLAALGPLRACGEPGARAEPLTPPVGAKLRRRLAGDLSQSVRASMPPHSRCRRGGDVRAVQLVVDERIGRRRAGASGLLRPAVPGGVLGLAAQWATGSGERCRRSRSGFAVLFLSTPLTPPEPSWRSMFLSHRGAVRTANEDSFLEAPDLGLWVIADGMGGHEAGRMASATVIHMLEGVLAAPSAEAVEASVRERIAQANERLQALSRDTYGGRTIGSTVAVLILRPGTASCLWAGDSRIYRLRGGRLERLTRDHSRTEELIAQGRLEPARAERHPLSNVITRAVGAQADLVVERRIEPLRISDRFLLCSDGLYRTVTDDELADILPSGDCGDAARELMAVSLIREPADNVTLGVIHVMHPDAGIAPAAA